MTINRDQPSVGAPTVGRGYAPGQRNPSFNSSDAEIGARIFASFLVSVPIAFVVACIVAIKLFG